MRACGVQTGRRRLKEHAEKAKSRQHWHRWLENSLNGGTSQVAMTWGKQKTRWFWPVSLIMLRRDFCFAPGYDVNTKLQLSLWRSEFCNYSSSFHSLFFFFPLAACNNARHWADSSDSHHWAKDGATWSDWASLGKHSLWQTPTVMYKKWLYGYMIECKCLFKYKKTAIMWSAKMPLRGYSDKWKNEVMSKEKQQILFWMRKYRRRMACVRVCV